jgi:hypothetical protein
MQALDHGASLWDIEEPVLGSKGNQKCEETSSEDAFDEGRNIANGFGG